MRRFIQFSCAMIGWWGLILLITRVKAADQTLEGACIEWCPQNVLTTENATRSPCAIFEKFFRISLWWYLPRINFVGHATNVQTGIVAEQGEWGRIAMCIYNYERRFPDFMRVSMMLNQIECRFYDCWHWRRPRVKRVVDRKLVKQKRP